MTNDFLIILRGLPWTLSLTAVALILGALLGLPIVLARQSRLFVVSLCASVFIAVTRSIPPLVWLFVIFFGLGSGLIRISPFLAATTAFGLIAAANMAEIYRGGLIAINHGQWEAAKVLNLGRLHILIDVIAPQAFRVALPSVASYAIGLLKDTATASVIGVTELTFQGTRLSQKTFNGLYIFGIVAVIYIMISLPIAWISRAADGYLRAKVAR